MAKSFVFLTLLALFPALPNTLSAKIPDVGTSASLQAEPSTTMHGSPKPMTTPYVVAGAKSLEKRQPQADSTDATSASSTRTRPHYTSFLTARADEIQASAGNSLEAPATATQGTTHAHYTTFYGARSDMDGSQSGVKGQGKVVGGQQGRAGNRQMQAGQGKESSGGAQNDGRKGGEEELEDCDSEEERDEKGQDGDEVEGEGGDEDEDDN